MAKEVCLNYMVLNGGKLTLLDNFTARQKTSKHITADDTKQLMDSVVKELDMFVNPPDIREFANRLKKLKISPTQPLDGNAQKKVNWLLIQSLLYSATAHLDMPLRDLIKT